MPVSPQGKRLRARAETSAVVFSFAGFDGVFDGVGSMPAERDEDAEALFTGLLVGGSSRAAAAFAILSAVSDPETLRTVSSGSCWRCLRGEGTGETMAALLWIRDFLAARGDARALWRDAGGEGVRLR